MFRAMRERRRLRKLAVRDVGSLSQAERTELNFLQAEHGGAGTVHGFEGWNAWVPKGDGKEGWR